MPVQIHEVIIRVTVAEKQSTCAESPTDSTSPAASSGSGNSNEQIAEQIFEILKAKRER